MEDLQRIDFAGMKMDLGVADIVLEKMGKMIRNA
jgi:hypothetical protein